MSVQADLEAMTLVLDEYSTLIAEHTRKARKDAERITELEAALDLCMIGGNYLVSIFGCDHPHHGCPHDLALAHFGPGRKYDAWCCWDAIMRARDMRDASKTKGE